jgi:hypothetical protein
MKYLDSKALAFGSKGMLSRAELKQINGGVSGGCAGAPDCTSDPQPCPAGTTPKSQLCGEGGSGSCSVTLCVSQ